MADIVNNAIRARLAGYAEQQGLTEDMARKRAGQTMAAGNLQGAADELYGAGMIDDGLRLENVGAQREALASQQASREQAAAQEEQKQRAAFLREAATVLRQIPAEQRGQAFQGQIAPALKTMGMDDELLGQMVNHLDDNSLNTFIGEIDNQMKMFNTASGVVGVDQQGNAKLLYEDPVAIAYKQAQTEAQRALVPQRQASADASRARAAKTRATPVGGRGGTSPAAKLPAGFILD